MGGSCKVIDDKSLVCTNGNTVIIHYGHPTEIDAELVKSVISAGAGRIGYTPNGKDIPSDIAHYIDHTLLNPQATPADIKKLCEEARAYNFASVCVNPSYIKYCSELLRGTGVKVCSVVGFPFGATTPDIKAMEARRAIRDGAREIDMVINVGALKGGDQDLVLRDIRAVVEACRDGGAISKVIIETALLTDDEKFLGLSNCEKSRGKFRKNIDWIWPGRGDCS